MSQSSSSRVTIVPVAPALNPIPQPAILSSLAPDFCHPTRVFSGVFLTDMSPVVWVRRNEFSAVGAISQISRNPAAPKFEEELLQPINGWRSAYDVVKMFILFGEAQKAFAGERNTAAVEHV